MVKSVIPAVIIAGEPGKPIGETLQDYKIKRVKKVALDGPVAAYHLQENKIKNVTGTIWEVIFDVKPKHNPEADIDLSKSPYMYGWGAGNGVLDGDWVRDKMLFVNVVKAGGSVKLEVIGTGL